MSNLSDLAGTAPTRRSFLSGISALATVPWVGARGPRPDPTVGRRLIVVWLDGGLSHLDSFDPKPAAPADVRGELGARPTALDGVLLSEHLPRLAARLDRCALLRSLTHHEANHDRGAHYLLTGQRPSPVVEHAALGAVLAGAAADDRAAMPAYIAIPTAPAQGGAGFLPGTCAPFAVGGDPGRPEFEVEALSPRDAVARAGVELLAELDAIDGAPRSAGEAVRDRIVAAARALREDPTVRAAFRLRDEPAALRDRYGRHRLGQSCLLARRLAAAGARCVVVRDEGWDHHAEIGRALTYGFPPKLPALDQAVAALLDDLWEQGLADAVTVLVASEFGRTPRLNPAGGRDHWPRAQSALLFGGGVRRGVVVGATDARGEEPVDAACSPGDLFATLALLAGLDLGTALTTPELGRPIPLVESGARPVQELLA
ncbi:MAG: DUF1501 domain-containing protein [Planctomycetes bacterium]|nr:DUF1501 domain-containing protein [Planctomycetota bacterium]